MTGSIVNDIDTENKLNDEYKEIDALHDKIDKDDIVDSLLSDNNNSKQEYKKYINYSDQELKELALFFIEQMTIRSNDWYQCLTFIRYKYENYQYWSTSTSVAVIILSSIITFLEATKSYIFLNKRSHKILGMCILTISFLITLITSIVKFFNIQSHMENLKSSTVELSDTFDDVNRLLCESRCNIEIHFFSDQVNRDISIKFISNLNVRWQEILKKSIKPMNKLHNIINTNDYRTYLIRFNESKNNNLFIMEYFKRNKKIIEKVESNLSVIEKNILEKTILNTSDTNQEVEDLRRIVNDLKSFIDVMNKFKETVYKSQNFNDTCCCTDTGCFNTSLC